MNINVAHTAKLANLSITKDEEEKFGKQLSGIITYVEKLQEVETKDITPTSQVTGLESVLREDTTSDSLPKNDAISQAPTSKNSQFEVKGIFSE